MDVATTKGVCIVLLFVDTIFFGWMPYLLIRGKNKSERSIRKRYQVISYFNCFAGGVFLGACLLHLLAEGREVMEEYFSQAGVDIDFPVYECVMAVGFFLIALIEQLAHRILHQTHDSYSYNHNKERSQKDSAIAGPKTDRIFMEELRNVDHTGLYTAKQNGLDNPAFFTDPTNGKQGNYRQTNGNDTISLDTRYSKPENSSISNLEQTVKDCNNKMDTNTGVLDNSRTGISIQTERLPPGSITTDLSQSEDAVTSFSNNADVAPKDIGNGHDHTGEIVKVLKAMEATPLRAFLLLGAMSFHTVFDGLAVGLQTDQKDVWEMFGAICIHKTLVAIGLGLQLFLVYKSKPVKAFFWIFFFSLISPIGVGIGMLLTSGDVDELASGLTSWILQAISSGTFLYVTFFEILREELADKAGLLKLFVMVLGFGGMVVAKVLDAD